MNTSTTYHPLRPNNDIHNVDSDTQLNLLPMVNPSNPHGNTANNEDIRRDEIDGIDVREELVMRTYNPRPQYVPPLNFSLVEDGIYRSGFPMPINYTFLKQLGLKTIIYVGDIGLEKDKKDKKDKEGKEKKEKEGKEKKDKEGKEKKEPKDKKDKQSTTEIMSNYKEWMSQSTDITFHHLLMQSSQEPFNSPEISLQAQQTLTKALQLMLDKRNFPILIHSNKGKHRIGLLVGLMRKLLQGWCLSGIFEEYEKFAMGKSEFDLEIIELWQPELWVEDEWKPDFVRV